MITQKSKYYLIEDEQLLAKARAFRQASIDQSNRYWEFVMSIGGDAYQVGWNDCLIGVRFPHDKRPPGWCKPKEHRGVSYPMKKSDWRERMFAIGRMPQIVDFLPELEDTPCSINHDGPTGKGSHRIGSLVQPIQICWYSADSPFMVMLPDVERAVRVTKIEHPDATIQGEVEKWRPPAGLREILIEEWNFMVAKYEKEADGEETGK